MPPTTGRTVPGSEPAIVGDLARRAEDRFRTAALVVLLAIVAMGQSAWIIVQAAAPPVLVYAEVAR